MNLEEKIKEERRKWRAENAPLGTRLGYPDCCINEFCNQPPFVMALQKNASEDDNIRFRAAHVNGVFSGFIPCIFHANQIMQRKITLDSLIKNRDSSIPNFPNFPTKII